MAPTTEPSKNSSWIQRIIRPHYLLTGQAGNLALALAAILLPTFFGLVILFVQFLGAADQVLSARGISVKRDTLVLAGYQQSIQLYHLTREAFNHPQTKDSLRSYSVRLQQSIGSVSAAYAELVGRANVRDRDDLLKRFNALSADYDVLLTHAKKVFRASQEQSVNTAANKKRRESSSLKPFRADSTFIPQAEAFLEKMRKDFEELLRIEFTEDIEQVRVSSEQISQSVLRTSLISVVLFLIGAGFAFVIVRQESEAREGTRRFQSLFEYSMNPIQVVDAEGKTLYVNPAYERWMNKRPAELVGRPAFERVTFLNEHSRENEFWEYVLETLKAGKAWSGDVEINRKGEGRVYAFLIISPVVDRSGKLFECIGIHHDVTERRELTRKFEESQEKYQNIVESSLDGIVIVQDGRLVFVNSSAMKIFGYSSAEDMKAVSFTDTVAPASRFFVLEGYQGRLIGEDILRNYELKGLTRQGKIIDLEVNAKLVSWNGRPAVQASFRDITERKSLEREQALWLWEQETMSTIDRQLVSSVDLQVVLDNISHHAKILTRADWAGVMLFELSTNQVRWRAVKGNQVPMPKDPFHLGKVHAEIVGRSDPVVMQDFGANPNFPVEEFPPFKEENIVSAARFPLIVDREIQGQLVIGYRQHHEFAARELRLLTSLAEKSSIALANAQLYDSLLSRERELELLSGARVAAQEEERRRIAREIHDSLGQMLTAIKFNVEILEDAADLQGPEERQRIADIKALLDTSMGEAREISYNLMPSVLVDFGLVPALQMLCEQFFKRNDIKLNFHTRGVENRLEATLEIGLYRIAQEALNNVAKHAHASEVNVQLIADEKSLRLTIDDDGEGFNIRAFDPQRKERHGMGLVSMRERATSFSGIFIINSKPGRGTEIIVEIPLSNSHG